MNGIDHYKQAQQILENVTKETTRLAARSDMDLAEEQHILQAVRASMHMAQVHATLALVASNIATDREHFAAWRAATGTGTLSVDAARAINVQATHDLLCRVEDAIPLGWVPSLDEIALWTAGTRSLVSMWAIAVHLAASDNDVEIPDVPDVLESQDGESA